MSDLVGIYALWYREIKVFLRERSRLISSIVTPLMWLVIFGTGLGSSIAIGGIKYQSFIYPGIFAQSILFSSIFFGVYIVWDRKIDFLKEVLIAPMSRVSVFIGKVLGGATDAMIQVLLLLVLGFALMQIDVIQGINMNVVSILFSFIILFVATTGFVSLGLIMGSQMESPEGFQMIGTFILFPIFFLSGALFPINNLPPWLAPVTFLDPLTYVVDGVRGALIGVSQFNVVLDLGVISIFSLVMIFIGAYAFKKMKM